MSENKTPSEDVALLCGPTEDGAGARIVRAKDGVIAAGEIRPVKDGQSLNGGELVRLRPRAGAPRICDVEVLHAAPAAEQTRVAGDGPAQVATARYRSNWDQIFRPPSERGGRDGSLN
jgi:hypothetical protein